jgi:hypothetical protein
MTSRTSCALLCAAALLSVAPGALRAQTTSPNTKLLSARALYYTPTVQGLKSFHCTVDFDWKDFLTRYSGAEVKDDSPYLQYLRTIHLAVADERSGDGKLEWTTSSATPEGKEDAIAKIKDGMQQMMVGFFSSWNGYMNGNMVPAPDSTTTVTENGDGLRLHAAAETTEVTELFDKNLLLTEAHVVQPASAVSHLHRHAGWPRRLLYSHGVPPAANRAASRAQHSHLLHARAELPHPRHAQLRAQERRLLRVQVFSLFD